jgi:hypothetical protein
MEKGSLVQKSRFLLIYFDYNWEVDREILSEYRGYGQNRWG